MEKLYRNRIKQGFQNVVHDLKDAEVIVDRLISMNVIDRKQHEDLKLYTGLNYNRHLITMLLHESSTDSPLEKFVSALETTGNTRLAGLLKHDISPDAILSTEDRELIQRHFNDILRKINLSEVLKILKKEVKYFDMTELETLQSFRNEKDQCNYFLTEVILKGTYRHLKTFKKALLTTGQKDVASLLPISEAVSHVELDDVDILVKIRMDNKSIISNRRDEIITKFMDPMQDLHKKVKQNYQLSSLKAEAVLRTSDSFILSLKTTQILYVTKITEDINSRHLAAIIMQYAHLPEKQNWRLSLTLQNDDTLAQSHHVNYTEQQNEMSLGFRNSVTQSNLELKASKKDNPTRIVVSAPTNETRHKSIQPPVSNLTAISSSSAQVMLQQSSLLFQIINGKDHTPYDFYKMLLRFKQANVNPLEIVSDGLTILHACVDKGRMSFLTGLIHIGWWNILYNFKVSENSQSSFKGKTAIEIAETKRAKKPVADLNRTKEWENSLSVLMKACRSGDRTKARQQIQIGGTDVFLCDTNCGNALYWTVVSGDMELFNELISMGVDPGLVTKKNENLLHIACIVGNSNMVSVLLTPSFKLNVRLKDHGNKSPIDRVAENGDVDTLKEFVKQEIYPDPSSAVLGAFMGRSSFLIYLFDVLNLPIDSLDMYKRTPLHRACEGSKNQVVKYLIDKGADITRLTCSNRNLLHIIAENGSNDLLELVIILFKQKGILEDMINMRDRYHGVELCFLIRGRDKGRDAWHYCEVKRDKVPIFLEKTKMGNVDVRDYGQVIESGWGVSPSQDMVESIEERYKIRRLDESAATDMTPLHIALFKGNKQIAKRLIEVGANVNLTDCFGNTPLMIAASKGNLEAVCLLERRGCDFRVKNSDHRSTFDIAEENQQEEIQNYIKGRTFHQVTNGFKDGNIAELERKLSRTHLDRIRDNSVDVKRYIIDTLREFKIEINTFLEEIGSGPVLEASDDNFPTSELERQLQTNLQPIQTGRNNNHMSEEITNPNSQATSLLENTPISSGRLNSQISNLL